MLTAGNTPGGGTEIRAIVPRIEQVATRDRPPQAARG
jgi:hypothetical protein